VELPLTELTISPVRDCTASIALPTMPDWTPKKAADASTRPATNDFTLPALRGAEASGRGPSGSRGVNEAGARPGARGVAFADARLTSRPLLAPRAPAPRAR
jgi:hypothetical protein